MLKVTKHGAILNPTRRDFENKSVFNPAVYQEGKKIQVIYRAMSKDFKSCFGYAELDGPLTVAKRWKRPFLLPETAYEKKGIEDPRVVRIDGTFYVTYVAHDGFHALIAYMYGPSLFRLKRGGVISTTMMYRDAVKLFADKKLRDDYFFFASFYEKYAGGNVKVWEKDGVLFPEKFRGRFALVHRILPDMQLAYFKDFRELESDEYWKDHISNLNKHVIMENRHGWEGRHIGAGAPPVKTDKGWLVIYHACQSLNRGRAYFGGAALLDLKNPKKLVARLPYPLLKPEEKGERAGHVHDVVFPTGTALFGDRLYIYYGSADSRISVASVSLEKLLKELLKNKVK